MNLKGVGFPGPKKEIAGKFESSNLSRDDFSGQIGRNTGSEHPMAADERRGIDTHIVTLIYIYIYIYI